MIATDAPPLHAPAVGVDDKPVLPAFPDIPPDSKDLTPNQSVPNSLPNGHVHLDSSSCTSPMPISPSDPASQPPPATPSPPPVQTDAIQDIKMGETPEAIVEEMLISNAASPDVSPPNGVPNGRIESPDGPNMDVDGDVDTEQMAHLNGHVDDIDVKVPAHHDTFTVCHPPDHVGSPLQVNADADDDARPPPAKRARKFSDADQASLANTASPPPVTASTVQLNDDSAASLLNVPSTSAGAITLSVQQHRFCLSTVRSLKRMKDAAAFLHPVDPVALNIPHYPSIIKNPMDLGTIERKLMSSSPQKPDSNPNNPRYNNADEFIIDVRLVFTNCLAFNGPDHAITKAGKHVESVFDKQIKNLPPPQVVKPPVKIATPPPPPPPPAKKVAAPPQAPARRASTSVPVIRRNDMEQTSARPKREIHPPPPKDLPYADAPKKLRKTKVVKDDGTVEQMKFCGKLLGELHRKQHWPIAHPFYEPVDAVKLEIPTYFKIIKRPMDLSTMRRKLENHEYPNASKFFDDFKLMIRNCFTFNPAGTPVNQAGIELQRLFDEKWKNLPPLREASEYEEEEYEDESEEERKRRIATMEAQIESMRGNLLALKNQPPKEKKKKKKESKPVTVSTSKPAASRNATKVATAGNGTSKRKGGKKQLPEDDTLSFDQKKDLSEAITKLDGQKLEKVIQIIHEGVPEIRDSTEEIEIEIDLLPVHVLTKLYNFVLRPLRQPPQKRSRPTGKGTGTGGLKRKSMDENAEAEKIRQLEERMKLFDNPSGNTAAALPIHRPDDSDHSSDSSSDDSSGSESD